MVETYNLELNFKKEDGKSKKITIRRPIAGLTEVEVLPAMQAIVDSDVFIIDGIDQYATAESASYVRRSVEDIFEVAK